VTIDRLAWRVLDFLGAVELFCQARVVGVEDPIDITTAEGRAFATLLAVLREMGAAATTPLEDVCRAQYL
jgi:site-specific DNA recombinase